MPCSGSPTFTGGLPSHLCLGLPTHSSRPPAGFKTPSLWENCRFTRSCDKQYGNNPRGLLLFLPILRPCQATAECHSQDFVTDVVKTQTFPSPGSLTSPMLHSSPPPLQPLTTTNWLSIYRISSELLHIQSHTVRNLLELTFLVYIIWKPASAVAW